MTSAQGWVLLGLIGVFAAALLTVTLSSQQSLKGYLGARIDNLRFELGGRMDRVEQKVDGLDRDVQTLTGRFLRDPP